MNANDRAWARAQEAWDDGRDPLGDPVVAERAAASPEFAAQLCHAIEGLALVSSSDTVPTKHRSRWRRVALPLGIAVAAVVLVAVWWPGPRTETPKGVAPDLAAGASATPVAEIYRFRVRRAQRGERTMFESEHNGTAASPSQYTASSRLLEQRPEGTTRIDLNDLRSGDLQRLMRTPR